MHRTFGVEIEVNTQDAYGENAHLRTVNRKVTISRRDGWGSVDASKRTVISLEPGWNVVYDGSCGTEFVSPPLINVGSIKKQLDHIEKGKLDYSLDDCGLHVHVGAQDIDEDDLMRVAMFCRYFDRTIFSFMPPHRIKDQYCRPICKSNQKITRDILENQGGGRYTACNISAWWKFGTIEFRYADGSTTFEEISAYIHFFVGIVEWVKNNPNFKLKCRPNINKKRKYLLSLIEMPETMKRLLLRKNTRGK